MRRLSFFRCAAPFDLAAVAALADARLGDGAEGSMLVRAMAPLDRADRDEVAVFYDGLDIDDLRGTRAGACLLATDHVPLLPPTTVALITVAPRDAFILLSAALHPSSSRPASAVGTSGIDASARVAPTARFEPGVIVDPGAIVGPDVEIGAGSFVGALCLIGEGVRVGRDCAIGAGVILSHALLGDRVVVQPGARLGHAVRGSADPGDPSLGRVIVQNDVEIGANAIVPRGRLRDTVIGEGVWLEAQAAIEGGATVERGRRITGLPPAEDAAGG